MADQNQHLIRKRRQLCRKAATLPVKTWERKPLLGKIPKAQKSLSFQSCLLSLPGQNWLILKKQKEAPQRRASAGWLSSVGTKSSEGWKQITESHSYHFCLPNFHQPSMRKISKHLQSSHLFFPRDEGIHIFKKSLEGEFYYLMDES